MSFTAYCSRATSSSGLGQPSRDFDRISPFVHRDENDHAVRRGAEPVFWVARAHDDDDVHAPRAPSVNESGVCLHDVPDEHGLVEADASDVDGHAVLAAPSGGAGV